MGGGGTMRDDKGADMFTRRDRDSLPCPQCGYDLRATTPTRPPRTLGQRWTCPSAPTSPTCGRIHAGKLAVPPWLSIGLIVFFPISVCPAIVIGGCWDLSTRHRRPCISESSRKDHVRYVGADLCDCVFPPCHPRRKLVRVVLHGEVILLRISTVSEPSLQRSFE